jgi:hypothetical protein
MERSEELGYENIIVLGKRGFAEIALYRNF